MGGEAGGEGAQERVVAFGDQGRHIKGEPQMGVALAGEAGAAFGFAGLPAARGEAGPGAEGAGIGVGGDGR